MSSLVCEIEDLFNTDQTTFTSPVRVSYPGVDNTLSMSNFLETILRVVSFGTTTYYSLLFCGSFSVFGCFFSPDLIVNGSLVKTYIVTLG